MKKSLILLAFVSSSISSNAQLIMKVEMKVPVEVKPSHLSDRS